MANNVYIGNRYVPMFADPVEWDSLRTYEALTIVTYLGTSYTSKKAVPAGIQLNNTDYWVVTGNYNAYIQKLVSDIETINETTIPAIDDKIDNVEETINNRIDSEVTTINNQIDSVESDINDRIDHVNDKKFIFLADSYGQDTAFNYPVWTELVPQYLGLSSGDYYAKGFSGAGFVGGSSTFLAGLEDIGTNITDKSTITDIYVLGGINDQSNSIDDIETAIETFMTYCKNNYANAHVHIGVISLNTDGIAQFNMRTKVVPAYMRCPAYGASFVNGMDFIARYDYLNSDGSHPSQTGQEVLSRYIADYVLNGYSGTKHEGTTFQLGGVNGVIGGDRTVITYEKNGTYTMKLQGRAVYLSYDGTTTTIDNTPTSLFSVPSNAGCFPHGGSEFDTPVTFLIKKGGTWSDKTYQGVLLYDGVNGIIKISYPIFSISNVEGVALSTFEFTSPTYMD